MTVSRGAVRPLITSVALILLALGLLAVVPSVIARYAIAEYLQSQGLSVTIDSIDVNLLTGHAAIDDAHAEVVSGPHAGQGFTIGHLGVSLAYAPLFDKKVVVENVTLRGAAIDITRTADNSFVIGGIPLPEKQSSSSSTWRFALRQIRVGALRVHYRQPAMGDSPAMDQVVTLNQSGAEEMVTWHEGDPIPVDAHLAISGASLSIQGRIRPLGETPSADVHIDTENFPIDMLAPLARQAGLTQLDGRLDTDLDLSVAYDADQALAVHTDGSMRLETFRLTQTSGMQTEARLLAFTGQSDWKLMRASEKPGAIATDGRFTLDGLALHKRPAFDLRADRAVWEGTGHVSLDDPFRITTHGAYEDKNIHLNAGGRIVFGAAAETLTGDLEATFGAKSTTIVTDGDYTARKLDFSVPGSIATGTRDMRWQGTTQTTLIDNTTRIDTRGSLDATSLDFRVANSGDFSAGHFDWDGQTHIASGKLFVHSARGHLVADTARLDLPFMPMAFTADRIMYDGRYAQQPTDDGERLQLLMTGDAAAQELDVRDTQIDAPWIATLQNNVDNIEINGLSDIRFDKMRTSGVRIMGHPDDTPGDTPSGKTDSAGDTRSPVVQAVSLNIDAFRLTDLLHYELDSAQLTDAIIHIRRDKEGFGTISAFMGAKSKKQAQKQTDTPKNAAQKTGGSAYSTFAVKHLGVSGPAIWFVDSATTPNVALHGLDLNLVVNGLDTAQPNKDADYRLSVDLGAYGHFDSVGTIAPLATGGMNMDLEAWLRSMNMPSLSGYLNQAMGRKIARGAINGTLDMTATDGQLNGKLDASISNFRLANQNQAETNIAFGINMETALALVRGQDDEFHFETRILGDVTNPYFSVNNLIREAVLAGLRTALLSNYSPVGLANKLRTTILNLFRSVEDRPAVFAAGKHYVQPKDRQYLGLIAQAMNKHYDWVLSVKGQAVPTDAEAMDLFQTGELHEDNRLALKELARQREEAVRDYLAARGVSPERIVSKGPVVLDDESARPIVRFTLDKNAD